MAKVEQPAAPAADKKQAGPKGKKSISPRFGWIIAVAGAFLIGGAGGVVAGMQIGGASGSGQTSGNAQRGQMQLPDGDTGGGMGGGERPARGTRPGASDSTESTDTTGTQQSTNAT